MGIVLRRPVTTCDVERVSSWSSPTDSPLPFEVWDERMDDEKDERDVEPNNGAVGDDGDGEDVIAGLTRLSLRSASEGWSGLGTELGAKSEVHPGSRWPGVTNPMRVASAVPVESRRRVLPLLGLR